MKRPSDFECVLGGVVWSIYFVRRGHAKLQGKNFGICFWHEKKIFVRYDVCEKTFVDTLLHEMQHALSMMHYEAETWITQTSTEIAAGLIAAGVGVKC